jgi:acetoacetate decarboxylase
MGWVKTPEEIARIQRVLAAPRFTDAERLQVDFLTTPEFVRSVLPPGLEPAAEPIVSASVGMFRSANRRSRRRSSCTATANTPAASSSGTVCG